MALGRTLAKASSFLKKSAVNNGIKETTTKVVSQTPKTKPKSSTPKFTTPKPRTEAQQTSNSLRTIRRRYEKAAKIVEEIHPGEEGQKLARRFREEAWKYKKENISRELKGSEKYKEDIKKAIEKGLAKSEGLLQKSRSKEQTIADFRKDLVGRAMLETSYGKSFWVITKDAWNGKSSYEDRLNVVLDELGVTNTYDAIKKVEEITGYKFEEQPEGFQPEGNSPTLFMLKLSIWLKTR